MYTTINGVAIAIIAKAGTQSITEAVGGWYINNQQALIYPQRVMFIREPFDRLESCYSFFCDLRDTNQEQHIIPVGKLESWESFVDYILVNKDEHWTPQADSVMFKGEFTPTHIFKFEDINNIWPKFTSRRLPHLNKATRKATSNYREQDLLEYYKDDIVTYNNAKSRKKGEEWLLE